MLDQLRDGDVVIVWKLDRLSRSLKVRWSPFPGQVSGVAKLGSDPRHAAA